MAKPRKAKKAPESASPWKPVDDVRFTRFTLDDIGSEIIDQLANSLETLFSEN